MQQKSNTSKMVSQAPQSIGETKELSAIFISISRKQFLCSDASVTIKGLLLNSQNSLGILQARYGNNQAIEKNHQISCCYLRNRQK